jgi:hypothetical protein
VVILLALGITTSSKVELVSTRRRDSADHAVTPPGTDGRAVDLPTSGPGGPGRLSGIGQESTRGCPDHQSSTCIDRKRVHLGVRNRGRDLSIEAGRREPGITWQGANLEGPAPAGGLPTFVVGERSSTHWSKFRPGPRNAMKVITA